MQSTRASLSGRIQPPADARGRRSRAGDGDRSKAWARAIDALPHALHLYKGEFERTDAPTLQRVSSLAGSPITPEKWAGLDRSTRQEVVELLSRTGVSVGDLAPRGSRPAPKRDAGAQDHPSTGLGLSWARLADDLPFNLYYNTVDPSFIPAAHRGAVDVLGEQLADRSALDLPGWKDLPPTVRHALIYRRIRFHLDPNWSSPITRNEWQAMKPDARHEVLALLQDSGFGLAHFQRPKARESHAGRTVQNTAPADSGGGDERQYELTSSVTSLANIVTPVVSRADAGRAQRRARHFRLRAQPGRRRGFAVPSDALLRLRATRLRRQADRRRSARGRGRGGDAPARDRDPPAGSAGRMGQARSGPKARPDGGPKPLGRRVDDRAARPRSRLSADHAREVGH